MLQQRQGRFRPVVLQSESLLCKEPLLDLAKREAPGNGAMMGAGMEHGCLEYDLLFPASDVMSPPTAASR
jgi:hypothetical protein